MQFYADLCCYYELFAIYLALVSLIMILMRLLYSWTDFNPIFHYSLVLCWDIKKKCKIFYVLILRMM